MAATGGGPTGSEPVLAVCVVGSEAMASEVVDWSTGWVTMGVTLVCPSVVYAVDGADAWSGVCVSVTSGIDCAEGAVSDSGAALVDSASAVIGAWLNLESVEVVGSVAVNGTAADVDSCIEDFCTPVTGDRVNPFSG